MDEFTKIFIEEAHELLSQLETDLLALENHPENRDLLDKVFRVMHTLKGNSGMCGFPDIQNLAHDFESIFDHIREGRMNVTAEVIDATLQGKDIFLAMLGNEPYKDSERALTELLHQKFIPRSSPDISVEVKVTEQGASDQKLLAVIFHPDPAVFERGLDPAKTLDEVTNSGQARIIIHEGEVPWEKQRADKICNTSWEIYLLTTATPPEIQDIFMFYDPDEYGIFKLTSDSGSFDETLLSVLRTLNPDIPQIETYLSECLIPFNQQDLPNQQETTTQPEKNTDSETPASGKPEDDLTINVTSGKLDELMNLVSELVSQTAILEASASRIKDLTLENAVENLEKLTKRFRTNALDLRLVPVGSLLARFSRQVRDLSKDLNKKVRFIIEGQDIEIDKTILKSIEKPLIHIIRNSIDHGLEYPEDRIQQDKDEEGLLKISAFNSGVNVIIQVQDDGRGINLEKVREAAILKGYIQKDQAVTAQELLNLIMEPGFTTSENVSIVSGRGVGMDVVKKELNAVGGSVEIFTEKGLGTTITMKLPTTLSILDTLMVEVGESIVLIPMFDIEYCYKEKADEIFTRDNKYVQYKDSPIPFTSLREKFNYPKFNESELMVIVINKFDRTYAVIADRILGEYQAVIKPLGDLFVNQPFFSGGSILVNGKLALILDTSYLFTQLTKN